MISIRRFLQMALLGCVALIGSARSGWAVQEIHEGDVVPKNEVLDPLPPTESVPRERVVSDQVSVKVSSVRLMNDGGGQSEEQDLFAVVHRSTGAVETQAMRVTIARPESGKYRVLWFSENQGSIDRFETPREIQLGGYRFILVRRILNRTGQQEDMLFSMNSDRDLVRIPIEDARDHCKRYVKKTESVSQGPYNDFAEGRASFWFPVLKKGATRRRSKPRLKIVGDLQLQGSFQRDASALRYLPAFTVKAVKCRRALIDISDNAHR